jgi:hypothetical protein
MDAEAELSNIARETFEYSVIPWVGRKYEDWVRTWARPHPRDPRGLIQLPNTLFHAWQQRTPGRRLTSAEAQALGYPRVPGDADLARVRKELHEALGRCDWDRAHDLDAELRDLETQVAAVRLTALRPRQAFAR